MNKVYTNVDPACITDCGYQIVVSSPFVQIINNNNNVYFPQTSEE